MKPIINPWLFYWMEIANSIRDVSIIAAVLTGVVITFSTIMAICSNKEEEKENIYIHRKSLSYLLKIFIPTLLIATFTPLSNTMMKMLVADNVTPNNLEIVGDTIEEGVNYIFEKIDMVVEESRD